MNYYNPYIGSFPYFSTTINNSTLPSSGGVFKNLFNSKNLGTFINGTQKTLNIINQAIPIVKQVSPVMKNAKTMFKVMNEFKRVDNVPQPNISNNIENQKQKESNNNSTQIRRDPR